MLGWGDGSAVLSDGTRSWLGEPDAEPDHPALWEPAVATAAEAEEHWAWDLAGHLVSS